MDGTLGDSRDNPDGASAMARGTVSRRSVAIVAIALGLAVALLGATIAHNRADHAKTEHVLNRDLSNYALLVAEHTADVLRASDQLLLLYKDIIETGGSTDKALAFIGSELLPHTGLNQVGRIDADGLLIASTAKNFKRIDLSDREYFRFHAARDDAILSISKPLIGRTTGKLTIQLSRRLNKPDGAFGGVVVASLSPDYFARLHEQLKLGDQGIVNLVGLDGIVRVRRDMQRFTFGQDISKSRMFELLPGQDTGQYRIASVIDGVDRYYAYRRVRGYPVAVLVGVAADEALAELRENEFIHLLTASGLALLILALAGAILWMLRKERLLLARVVASQELAEKANRAKSDFLAKVTHEIRTPLHAVKGLSDYVLHTALSEEQRECLETVKDSSDHLIGMVNDLLDIARIEAGQLPLEIVDYDLHQLCLTVGRILAPLATDKGLPLVLDWRDGGLPPVVRGDPARLRQVVLNLVANAIKFTTVGEVRLAATLGPSEDPDRLRLELRVSDTGSGISPEALETIFEPFSQADNTISRRYGGTGLGLAICRQLLELMGGRLDVVSTLNRGSEFRVSLDLDRGDPGAVPAASEPARPLPAMAILVVDDNPTNLMVAERLLSRLGQTPDQAQGGHEALAALGRKGYDVVLLDIEMPEFDGFEVMRRLRAGEAGPVNADVPVIAMTAHSRKTFRQQCLEAGMQGFVSKPVVLERLHAALAGLVRRRAPAGPDAADSPAPDPAVPVPGRGRPSLDVAGALERMDGDGALYWGVCEDFVAKYDPDRIAPPDLVAAGEPAVRYLHTLKGLARTIGAVRLSVLAGELEAALRAGDREGLVRLADGLESTLRQTMAAIGAARQVGAAGR